MKLSNQHILEYLIINKDYRDGGISPKSFDELHKIIIDRYDKLGPGTEQNPIDFNDIDTSNIIDMSNLFEYLENFNGDISNWDVSNVTNMGFMFSDCYAFNQDISGWDVSKVKKSLHLFSACPIEEKYKPNFK